MRWYMAGSRFFAANSAIFFASLFGDWIGQRSESLSTGVALVARIRKLLTIVNAMVKHKTRWSEINLQTS